jgi:hypothetical protein
MSIAVKRFTNHDTAFLTGTKRKGTKDFITHVVADVIPNLDTSDLDLNIGGWSIDRSQLFFIVRIKLDSQPRAECRCLITCAN